MKGEKKNWKKRRTHRQEMPQHIDKFPLLCFFCQHFMKRAKLLCSNLRIQNHYWQITFIDSWICVIILVQVWFWPANIQKMLRVSEGNQTLSAPGAFGCKRNQTSCFPCYLPAAALRSFLMSLVLQLCCPWMETKAEHPSGGGSSLAICSEQRGEHVKQNYVNNKVSSSWV